MLLLTFFITSFSYMGITESHVNESRQEDTTTSYTASTEELKSIEFPIKVLTMLHLRHLSITGMDCDYRVSDEKGNDVTQCWAIRVLPFDIGNLKELESISMPVNNIQYLPGTMRELKKLRVINFSDNSLSDVHVISEIPSLEEAYFFGCHLSKLPEDLSALKKLKKLGLTGNQISATEIKRIKAALPQCEVLFE